MASRQSEPSEKKRSRAKQASPSWRYILLGIALTGFFTGIGVFSFYWVKYSRMIDEKLTAGPFPNTSMLFGAPRSVRTGDEFSSKEIVDQLVRSGYTQNRTNRLGWYNIRPDAVEIFPGPDSYFDQEAGVIKFGGNKVAQIISLRDNTERRQYMLEPELVTNLFDRKREKRRLIRFADIPKDLVNAVVSIEDKRFFQHVGFDPLRIIKSAYVDVRKGYHAQGASTLSMQLARGFWLTPEKTWSRKIAETMITLQLELRLSKEEIFEYYANNVDMGRRGSFSIRGFGEAAQAYFGKDFRQLNVAECATLAGLIQRPSYTNPVRWPKRATDRRNVVLGYMLENGYINQDQYASAVASNLEVVKGGSGGSDAPYFIDLVNDELQDRFQEHDFQTTSYRVYTTLDPALQRVAEEAVRTGLEEVDKIIARRKNEHREAQVALVAIDPETGEIKALVGGRNYGTSQLNRAVAKRQPGSVFKPFVYAAAMNTALAGNGHAITPVSTLVDEPTTFWYDEKPYEPNNFKNEFHGTVTVRQALAKSMNIPTVKLAEAVGYDTVVQLARSAGMNLNIRPTPAVALGAYEVTPIEIAGAYTVFANKGVYTKPYLIRMIRDDKGGTIYENKAVHRQVLDARVSYLMVELLEEVMRSGTAAGVRARGFTLPAAGKTGTSHDGWFAGFTSKLICAVWVGFDDNTELNIEGAHSALPVWADFMKRAHQVIEYRGPHTFEAPEGVITAEIDPATGQLATSACPNPRSEVFIMGTQPIEACHLHGGGRPVTQVAGWDAAEPAQQAPSAVAQADAPPKPVAKRDQQPVTIAVTPAKEPEKTKEEKKGFFGKIRDIFK